MNIKLMLLLFFTGSLSAVCNREDRMHANPNIVRCEYTQENIYRCFSKKPGCYRPQERRKQCFYCGCPIEEHTKEVKHSKPIRKRSAGWKWN